MKRLLDITISCALLILVSPVLIVFVVAIYAQDWHSPFFIAKRVGKDFVPFSMIKLRSMILGDGTGPQSTSADDARITRVGRLVRRYKLDELTQLVNVFLGDMSLVGPRPNVPSEVALYTDEERKLLNVRPGITDIASIVFSDEGSILEGSKDPDLDYNQLIRPWKSRLGLFYISNRSMLLDVRLIGMTVISLISRPLALRLVASEVRKLGGTEDLVQVCLRTVALTPTPPPGVNEVATLVAR